MLVMFFQVTALLIRSMLHSQLIAAGIDIETAKNLSFLVVPAIEVILLWPVFQRNRAALLQLLRCPKPPLRIFIAAVCIGIAMRLAYWGAVFANVAFGWLGYAEPGTATGPQFWLACPPSAPLVLSIFVMAMLTPISEEIVNRGLVFGSLVKRNRIAAILVSSTLFAIVHAPQSIAVALVIGIVLALQTLSVRSLLPAMVTHATFNFLAILDWQCAHGIWNPEIATPQLKLFGAGAIVFAIAILAMTFWLATRVRDQDKLVALVH